MLLFSCSADTFYHGNSRLGLAFIASHYRHIATIFDTINCANHTSVTTRNVGPCCIYNILLLVKLSQFKLTSCNACGGPDSYFTRPKTSVSRLPRISLYSRPVREAFDQPQATSDEEYCHVIFSLAQSGNHAFCLGLQRSDGMNSCRHSHSQAFIRLSAGSHSHLNIKSNKSISHSFFK